MGRGHEEESSVDSDSVEESLDAQEQMVVKIKELPSLEEKVQAIALNSYLLEKNKLDDELEKETNAVESAHRRKYAPLLAEIDAIVNGQHEFTEADFEGAGDMLTDQEKDVKHNYFTKEPVQDYWRTVLMAAEVCEEMTEKDEPLLKHLTSIEGTKSEDGCHLTLTFRFSPNEWFTNEVVRKEFELEKDDIKRGFGDIIDWKEGKNITVKIVKKKSKNKRSGERKVKVTEVQEESFFNFFKEIDLRDEDEEEPENDEAEDPAEVLEKQHEMASMLYEQVIPHSLEYFLGLVSVCDDMLPGEDDEDSDEAEDEDDAPPKKKKCCRGKKTPCC